MLEQLGIEENTTGEENFQYAHMAHTPSEKIANMLILAEQQPMDRKQPLNVFHATLNEIEAHQIGSPRTCQFKGGENVMS